MTYKLHLHKKLFIMVLILSNIKKVLFTIISLLLCGLAIGQVDSTPTNTQSILAIDGVVTIDVDSKVEKLIAAKIKLNKSTSDDEFYKIQIYSGNLNEAEEVKKEFKKKYYDWSCNISFESPNYKVRVGKFRTRLEADKQLLEIRKKYSNAFLLTP